MKDIMNNGVDINDYPNSLAHIRVYPAEQTIEVISTASSKDDDEEETDKEHTNMPKKNDKTSGKGRKNSKRKQNDGDIKEGEANTDQIWRCMNRGKIDISYACVGYTYDGRPVLDHSSFVDLLINYGFMITDILPFIDEFAECAKDDDTSPIVMTNINVARIVTEIEPIAKKN